VAKPAPTPAPKPAPTPAPKAEAPQGHVVGESRYDGNRLALELGLLVSAAERVIASARPNGTDGTEQLVTLGSLHSLDAAVKVAKSLF